MATRTDNRWKAIVTLASDHGGIGPELQKLENEIIRVLARLDDPRKVRDYVQFLRLESRRLCEMRPGWLDRK